MSLPCPPEGGMITSSWGYESGLGNPPATISTVPNVYPDPWLVTSTDPICWSAFTVTVHSASLPSPLIGTLV